MSKKKTSYYNLDQMSRNVQQIAKVVNNMPNISRIVEQTNMINNLNGIGSVMHEYNNLCSTAIAVKSMESELIHIANYIDRHNNLSRIVKNLSNMSSLTFLKELSIQSAYTLENIKSISDKLSKLNLPKIQNYIGEDGIKLSKKISEYIISNSKFDLDNLEINEEDLDEVVSMSQDIDYNDTDTHNKINLKDIEEIINSKLEEQNNKTKDQNPLNQIILLLTDINNNQKQILKDKGIKKFINDVLLQVLSTMICSFLMLIGKNVYYNHINEKPKQVIQMVKVEIKDQREKSDNKEIYKRLRYVNKKGLQVRNTNKIKGRVIYKLNIADVIEVIDKRKEWVKINFFDKSCGEERDGWVLSKYIKKFEK